MVTIVDFVKRKNLEGVEFNALILQGGLELVKSKESGAWYATSKKASITSTLDDATCQNLIGQEIPGSVQRVECEPYDFTVRETGEVVTLTHRWIYLNEGEVLPSHNAFVSKMLQSPCHIILTIRSKTDYVLNEKNGKMVPEKVGLKGVTREGMDFELTTVFELDIRHQATVTKDRTGLFTNPLPFMITEQTGS